LTLPLDPCDILASKIAFKCNLYRYVKEVLARQRELGHFDASEEIGRVGTFYHVILQSVYRVTNC
jgi:hypothetical protein